MNADRDIRDKNLNIHIFESKAPVELCTKWICMNGSFDSMKHRLSQLPVTREILKGGLDGKI